MYRKQLLNWQGRHRDSLLQAWGTPVLVQPFAKDKEIYVYQYSQTVVTPAEMAHTTYENRDGNIMPVRKGFRPERRRNERCEYRFIIMPNGIIESVQWRGNACRIQ